MTAQPIDSPNHSSRHHPGLPRLLGLPAQSALKGYLAYDGCCLMSHTWRSPCSSPPVCRLFAPGSERERQREGREEGRERWGWVDKENTIGLFYYGRSTMKSSCVRPGPARAVSRVPGGACPSHGGKNGWTSANSAPRELRLHKITVRPVPSVPRDKDPRGKPRILCHCRAHAICVANTCKEVTFFPDRKLKLHSAWTQRKTRSI